MIELSSWPWTKCHARPVIITTEENEVSWGSGEEDWSESPVLNRSVEQLCNGREVVTLAGGA